MPMLQKIVDLAIPIALTLAIIVGLLWEHDSQMEAEEEEWDLFFTGRKQRNTANMQRLHGELATAIQNAQVQQEAVSFLQLQKKGLKFNITAAEDALDVARTDMKDLAQQTTAKDRAKAMADRKLYSCDEDHDQTMKKLKVLNDEAQSLSQELNILEKKKHRLTEVLNQAGVRAGKKSEVLLVEEKVRQYREGDEHTTTPLPTTQLQQLDRDEKDAEDEGAAGAAAAAERARVRVKDVKRRGDASPEEIGAMADKLKNLWEAASHPDAEEDAGIVGQRGENRKLKDPQKPTTAGPEVEAEDV